MKTVIRISNDYNSGEAHEEWVNDVCYFANAIQVQCEVSNSNYSNVVREQQKYTPSIADLPKVKRVSAKGYSQSDWQEYVIRYACEDDNASLITLVELLEKTFTHKNDYFVEKFERTEINGKAFDAAPHDYTGFTITDIEFPEKEDVLKAYNECYGEDYDECEISID